MFKCEKCNKEHATRAGAEMCKCETVSPEETVIRLSESNKELRDINEKLLELVTKQNNVLVKQLERQKKDLLILTGLFGVMFAINLIQRLAG